MNKIITIAGAVTLALSITGCGTEAGKDSSHACHSVYLTTPAAVKSAAPITYPATVEEGKNVNASFKTGGQVSRLLVDKGSYVTKGQVIACLDDDDYRLGLMQVEAQYGQMEKEMKRLDELFSRHNVAPNDYEKAKAGFEQLKAQLEITRNKLAYTKLEAPASGYIVDRYMEEGEMVGAGTPVFKIVDSSALEASVALPATAFASRDNIVSCSAKSPVTGDYEIPLETISFIPDADNNSLYTLRLRIPPSQKSNLTPGMNLSVRIVYDNERPDLLGVPSRAIFEREGSSYVWTFNPADSTVTATEVTLDGLHEGDMNFVSGLKANQSIVAAGVHHLTEGEKVTVAGDIDNLKNVGL